MAGSWRARKLWVWTLIAAALASAYIAAGRVSLERSNRQVDLVLDYDAAIELCRMAGYPLDAFLRRARTAGLTSVALNELTVGDLIETGKVRGFTGRQILDYDKLAPTTDPVLRRMIDEGRLFGGNTYLLPRDASTYGEIAPLISVRLSGERVSVFDSPRLGRFIETAKGLKEVEEVNLGLDPEEIREAKAADLRVVARFRNYTAVTPEKMEFFLGRLAEIDGVRLVIFEGQDVLGYPDHIREAANVLGSHGLLFGHVEFAAQQGDTALAKFMGPEVVRVHSITEREMNKIQVQTAVDRFVRAARERNIRVMYIRPFPAKAGEGLAAVNHNLEYIEAIARGISASGFTLGEASPFEWYSPARVLLVLVAAGILAGGFMLLDMVAYVPPVVELGLFVLGLIAYGGFVATRFATIFRQLAALGAAIVFPALAVGIILTRSRRARSARWGEGAWLRDAYVLWLEASAVSVLGGMLLAATLSSTSFMLHLDQFAGVKVAHVVPLMVVASLYWMYHVVQSRAGRSLVAAAGELLSEPIRVWHVVALAATGMAGLVYIMRTGNVYLGMPVPFFDEGMRVFLERALVFRPRTKEFLIGHPAMILAALAFVRGDRRSVLPLALLGCIGQISMVNTFSHLHTPLLATALRTVYGLVVGAIVGVVGYGLYSAYVRLAARGGVGFGESRRDTDVGGGERLEG
ncbi:MAG: DUF5693 family protein [Firmicutes bacterium]|jgi:hypothetical protein|nr:DUF5693 family protein [Bacillota bacterium]MDH7495252.1 DUF5693 family protein [Bacillota bacterium]